MSTTLSRRNFLKLSLFSGAGLALGFQIPEAHAETVEPVIFNLAQDALVFEPNAYLFIDSAGQVTLRVHRSELGQGINTSICMMICEELEVDLSSIHYEQSPADRVYGDQVTGGSVSISGSYGTVRMAGATAKTMLITAAAQTWGVDAATCHAESGVVYHDESGQSLSYGELVETASTLPVPERADVTLKDPADFKLIGTSVSVLDGPAMVTGQAQYCSDIKLEGMLVAVVAHAPTLRAQLVEFDATAALAIPGVQQVIEIPSGVAVLANDTWTALKGRDALEITWDAGEGATMSTSAVRQAQFDGLSYQNDPNVVEGVYEIPYLAHATLEPMTCVADVRETTCEVWAPTQDRQGALRAALRASENVTIHVPLIGGAFGRRLQVDYVEEAVRISAAAGVPVKLFWTRRDDFQNDYYHPASMMYMYAEIDPPGTIRRTPMGAGFSSVHTGAWRSVENFTDAFYDNFIDEVAAASGQDPLEAHLAEHEGSSREEVLRIAAEQAGWGEPLPEGWGRGIAAYSTFSVTHVAMVVEVSVEGQTVHVQRVVCAVNCGRVINPDGVKAQMEGGIIFALSAALHGEITVEEGAIQQTSYRDYPILRMDETPVIEVHIVESDQTPTGIGEMGVPPVTPALFNAIYAATGKRLRRIPVRPEDLA
jgi:isoquinoline 1-oxidoreductase beta subunit